MFLKSETHGDLYEQPNEADSGSGCKARKAKQKSEMSILWVWEQPAVFGLPAEDPRVRQNLLPPRTEKGQGEPQVPRK